MEEGKEGTAMRRTEKEEEAREVLKDSGGTCREDLEKTKCREEEEGKRMEG